MVPQEIREVPAAWAGAKSREHLSWDKPKSPQDASHTRAPADYLLRLGLLRLG